MDPTEPTGVQETTPQTPAPASESPPPPAPDPEPPTGTDDDPPLPQYAQDAMAKANREAAKYRHELRDAQAETQTLRAKIEEMTQTYEAKIQELTEAAQAAASDRDARVLAAERRAALTPLVTNPDRVLRLMDDPESYFDGSTPDPDRIRGDFPEYLTRTGPAAAPGAGGTPARSPQIDEADAALARGDVKTYAAILATRQAASRAQPKE